MARGKAKAKEEFVNPFEVGVSYADFLAALPDGVTASEYLKGKCTDEQLQWLESELEHYKNNLKTKK